MMFFLYMLEIAIPTLASMAFVNNDCPGYAFLTGVSGLVIIIITGKLHYHYKVMTDMNWRHYST